MNHEEPLPTIVLSSDGDQTYGYITNGVPPHPHQRPNTLGFKRSVVMSEDCPILHQITQL